MAEDHSTDFQALVQEAGIPTTEAAAKAEWQAMLEAEGSVVSNDSSVSPFWRLFYAIVTQPLMWLVNLIVTQWLPNSFVKTATGGHLDILAWGANVTRKGAVKAKGNILFTRSDSTGTLTVAAGTVVESPPINGTVYRVATVAEAIFADGESQIEIEVEAENTGEAYNLAAGYYAVLPAPLAGITSASNTSTWLTTPGADIEADDDLRDRVRNQFGAVNQWHIDSGYLAIVTEYAGLHIRNVFIEHDAPRGPGTANIYLLLDTGEPDAAFLTQVQDHIMLNGNRGLGDDIQVLSMPSTQHDLVVDVYAVSGLPSPDKAQLRSDVEQMIRAAFRENVDYTPTLTFPDSRFSLSRLGQELHRQFVNADDIVFDQGSIVNGWAIPRLNSLTVTVHGS
ncbi:hypothetical protein HBA55_34635 [Pseudomaricurvus alkylphenolicus]|uniref:baseplate J/gp47 family protein n=1 Tax=Pseudomaricurvus alkylphenolicus TaxID=1306991 RepID=UPI00141EC7B5|nr:baseplate J/gp47 family protein [Pseudomaricurvus alkylphenolicus]NIB44769.1 hypothetical protein [Pseudomaricurvus alkylphenolicus]